MLFFMKSVLNSSDRKKPRDPVADNHARRDGTLQAFLVAIRRARVAGRMDREVCPGGNEPLTTARVRSRGHQESDLVDSGTGNFFRTTDRIIYIRKPQIRHIMMNTGIREREATDICFKGKQWERDKMFESVVIKMSQVRSIKRKPGKGATLKVEDKRGRFIVSFGSPLVAFI